MSSIPLREISPEELPKYKIEWTPFIGEFRMRNLKYSEIRQLENTNEDIDQTIDDLILACTNLTSEALYSMPEIDREYVAIKLRAKSFVDNSFDVVLECEACTNEGNYVEKKIPIEGFEFIPPEQELFEEICEGDVSVIPNIRSYRLKKFIDSLPKEIPDWKFELLTLATYAVPNHATEKEVVEIAEVLEDNGILARKLSERLGSSKFGLQPRIEKWKCPKCGEDHVTEVDPAGFFSSPPST